MQLLSHRRRVALSSQRGTHPAGRANITSPAVEVTSTLVAAAERPTAPVTTLRAIRSRIRLASSTRLACDRTGPQSHSSRSLSLPADAVDDELAAGAPTRSAQEREKARRDRQNYIKHVDKYRWDQGVLRERRARGRLPSHVSQRASARRSRDDAGPCPYATAVSPRNRRTPDGLTNRLPRSRRRRQGERLNRCARLWRRDAATPATSGGATYPRRPNARLPCRAASVPYLARAGSEAWRAGPRLPRCHGACALRAAHRNTAGGCAESHVRT